MIANLTSLTRRQVYMACSLLATSVLVLLYCLDVLGPAPKMFKMQETSNAAATICEPAASYLAPDDLLDGRVNDIGHTARGIPKIIHQSWIDRDLPIRFKKWSDSFRLKHPEWKWVSSRPLVFEAAKLTSQVLWTDNDNDRLVGRHPEMNATYHALKNGIQRADFVRNLYMWDFGG